MSQDLPITIKRGFVDRSWGQVHYRTAGSGPALVLTHKTYYSSDEAARQALRRLPLFYGPLEVKEDGSHYTAIWQRMKPRWEGYPSECFELTALAVKSKIITGDS